MTTKDKAVSLSEREGTVRNAFNHDYGQRYQGDMYIEGAWVVAVYDTELIACEESTMYWRVPYSMDGGDVMIADRGQWERVERDWIAAKGIKLPPPRAMAGGAVKAVDGRLEGYAITFSGESDPDLEGDWFTAKTYLGKRNGNDADVLFHHSLGLTDTKSVSLSDAEYKAVNDLADRVVKSGASTRRDEYGLFASVVMDMHDDYERMLYELGKKGVLAWSSAASPHTVRRAGGKSAGEITRWIINELSLTPTPAEPRNFVEAVKSLVAVKDKAAPGAVPEASTQDAAQAADAMTEAELNTAVKAAVHEAFSEQQGHTKTEEDMGEETQTKDPGAVENQPQQGQQADTTKAELDALKAQFNELMGELKSLKAPVEKTPLNTPNLKHVTERGFADDHKKAFLHYIRTGDIGAVDAALKASNVNPLESATDAQGAVLVPDDMYPDIVEKRDEMSIMRRAGAEVISTSLDVVNVPRENGSATYFAITDQEGAVDEDEPTFANVPITIYTLTKLMKISMQLLADEKANLLPFLTRSAARAWAMTENKYFLTGTGSSQPQGIFVGGTAGLTFDSATAIGATEIPELVGKLDGPYRDQAGWFMNRTTDAAIRSLSGNFRWFESTPNGNAGVRGNTGDLEGYPVNVSNEVAAIGASAKSLMFGNVNAGYMIAERSDLAVMRLNELYAGNLQTGLLWVVRIGGAVVNAEALQYATHPSA